MTEMVALVVSEQRRFPQLSYKSDIIFISGESFYQYVVAVHSKPSIKWSKMQSQLLAISIYKFLNLGLDEGDRKVLEKHYRGYDPPCQLDPEDDRFVLKGPKFNPITVVNLLSEKRGYSIKGVPQQVKSLQVTKPIRRKITLNLNYSMAFH